MLINLSAVTGEVHYCALVGKPNWILCCRCTFVY